MTYMETLAPVRLESSELLKVANELRGDVISLQELDKPIALHVNAEKEASVDSMKMGDASDKPVIKIICRNESLAGDLHPVTGVPFERKTIDVDDRRYEVVVPQFEHDFNATLPEDLHVASDREQFAWCNEQLKDACAADPDLREKFTPEQMEQIENGDRPDGYVWHHAENPGEMQLIRKEDHDQTGHTGGKLIWGGGSENR